jgi:hypothetical protein
MFHEYVASLQTQHHLEAAARRRSRHVMLKEALAARNDGSTARTDAPRGRVRHGFRQLVTVLARSGRGTRHAFSARPGREPLQASTGARDPGPTQPDLWQDPTLGMVRYWPCP